MSKLDTRMKDATAKINQFLDLAGYNPVSEEVMRPFIRRSFLLQATCNLAFSVLDTVIAMVVGAAVLSLLGVKPMAGAVVGLGLRFLFRFDLERYRTAASEGVSLGLAAAAFEHSTPKTNLSQKDTLQ